MKEQQVKKMRVVVEKMRTLTNPATVLIIELLRGGEMNGREVEQATGCAQSPVSRNLKRLVDHGYVTYREEGKWKYFRLTGEVESVLKICNRFL